MKMRNKSILLLSLAVVLLGISSCSDDNDINTPGGGNTLSPIQITTTAISNITPITATSGGQIIDDGGRTIVERGVCWSTQPNPTIADSRTDDGGGTGSFSSLLFGLSPNTQYYVRAYAISTESIGYGNQLSFLTISNSLPVDVDGNIYDTVLIGNQVWMKQNLRVSRYRNGDPIPTNLGNTQWLGTSSGAYAIYKDSAQYDSLYGKLYNWYAVSDPRGLCPTGWHVPDIDEWDSLFVLLGGTSVAGGAMKDIGIAGAGGLWNPPNTGATNSSGFTGLPGGCRTYFGNYVSVGESGEWWASTQYSAVGGFTRSLYSSLILVGRTANMNKTNGSSVRCLRD